MDSDPEIESEDITLRSDDEFQLEIDKLKQRMTELETLRVKHQSRDRTEVPREFAPGSNQEPSLSMKPMNPAEGEMLGTFDGRTDLDAFLVRFRACSRNFKWSETEQRVLSDECLDGKSRTHSERGWFRWNSGRRYEVTTK